MGLELNDFVGEINLEESAGLEIEVAIADYSDIEAFPALPDLDTATENGDYVDLGAAVFTMKTGTMFHKWEGSLERNSFASNLGGMRGALSFQNRLTIAKNAINKHLVGWLRSNRNRRLVVAFKFLGDAQYTVIGWDKLWAEIMADSAMESAAEVQGDKTTTIVIQSIFYPPMFIDAIPFTPAV